MCVDGAMTSPVQNTAITAVPSVVIPSTGQLPAPTTDLSSLLYKIVTPYVPDAWRQALERAHIAESYPNLVHDLSHVSPIGNTPLISFTFIPNNLLSANINPEYISRLIAEEVTAGQMDGPFSIRQAHYIYGGHFRTFLLGLMKKPGSTALRMICHFLKEDHLGQSTNSWLDSDDFPTRWFTASQTADFVSHALYPLYYTDSSAFELYVCPVFYCTPMPVCS